MPSWLSWKLHFILHIFFTLHICSLGSWDEFIDHKIEFKNIFKKYKILFGIYFFRGFTWHCTDQFWLDNNAQYIYFFIYIIVNLYIYSRVKLMFKPNMTILIKLKYKLHLIAIFFNEKFKFLYVYFVWLTIFSWQRTLFL